MFFFTNVQELGKEPVGGNYGEIDEGKFRVSSQFTSRGPNIYPTAYAVTSGRIAVLYGQTNHNLLSKKILTIILQPDNQPGGNIPAVKYYIYKGILATSLLLDQKVAPNAPVPDNRLRLNLTNGSAGIIFPFMTRIKNNYEAWVARGIVPPLVAVNEDWLGFIRTNGESAKSFRDDTNTPYYQKNVVSTLDRIFNNNWGNNIPPLPTVNEGEPIGSFISSNFDVGMGGVNGQFTMEIVLDRVGNNAYFEDACGSASSNTNGFGSNFRIITTAAGLGSQGYAAENQMYNVNEKTEILRYMDPCAFYGAFANAGMPDLRVPIQDGVVNTHSSVGQPLSAKANGIYSDLIGAPGYDNSVTPVPITNSHLFINRNTIYIDIRDKFNNPYDFSRDKTLIRDSNTFTPANLRIGFNGNPDPLLKIDADYHGRGSNPLSQAKRWPLLAIRQIYSGGNFIGFPNNVAALTEPDGTTFNTIDLEFPNSYRNVASTCLFLNNASIVSPALFLVSDGQGFSHLEDNLNEWSKPIALKVPNFNGSNAVPICNYIQMWHLHCYTDFYEHSTIPEYDYANPNRHPIIFPHPFGPISDTSPNNNDFSQPMERFPQNYCDFLFPVDLELTWSGWSENNIRSTIYSELVYVSNVAISGYDFMGNIGIARDANNGPIGFVPKVTLFAYNTIPRGNSINMIDSSFNEAAGVYAFSDNASYLNNIGDNISEYVYNSRIVNGRQVDQMVRTNSIDPNEINVNDFVYFTIDKVDYDAIILQWIQFKNNNNNTVNPLKAWWSFEPISSGWDVTSSREFIQFEIRIKYLNKSSNYQNHPCKMESFVPINTLSGLPFDTIKLMDKFDFSSSTPTTSGRGFSIKKDGEVDRIQCTIKFIKSPNLTELEFISYKNYAMRNIRQIWSNQEGQDTSPDGSTSLSDYTNDGLTAYTRGQGIGRKYKITAWDIAFEQGCSCSFNEINDNEVVFLIDRTMFANDPNLANRERDRSAVFSAITGNLDALGNLVSQQSNPRRGRLVFVEPAGVVTATNPYRDRNTAAHEFGHILGLTDRYSFAVSVDVNNNVVRGTGMGVNFYLPPGIDVDYTQDYRWMMNLMSTGQNKVPNNLLPLDPVPPKYNNVHPDFFAAINGFQSADNAERSTGVGGNIFITPMQWEVIRQFAIDNNQFEENELIRPIFRYQNVAFFVPQGTVFPFGSFVGYDNTLGALSRSVSDYGFMDNGAVGIHTMNGRINGGLSVVNGFFTPFEPDSRATNPISPFTLVNRNSVLNPNTMFQIRLGNDIYTLFNTIRVGLAPNHPAPAIVGPAEYGGFPIINMLNPGFHNLLNPIGTSDTANFGRNVWNQIVPSAIGFEAHQYSTLAGANVNHIFNLVNSYDNRTGIMELITFGSY